MTFIDKDGNKHITENERTIEKYKKLGYKEEKPKKEKEVVEDVSN